MCCRYTLMVGKMNENLERIVGLCSKIAGTTMSIILKKDGEIHPNDAAPALIKAEGRIRAVPMRWGFEQDNGRLLINARGESAAERVTFRGLIEKNRCALPAAGYYEWRDADHLKHLISPADAEGFYLAGLYRMDEAGRMRFVVLTRDAYGEHARIHARMPVVLVSGEQVRAWLSGSISLDALVALAPEGLSIHPLAPEQMSMDFGDQSEA